MSTHHGVRKETALTVGFCGNETRPVDHRSHYRAVHRGTYGWDTGAQRRVARVGIVRQIIHIVHHRIMHGYYF